jgi:hypothetical protein
VWGGQITQRANFSLALAEGEGVKEYDSDSDSAAEITRLWLAIEKSVIAILFDPRRQSYASRCGISRQAGSGVTCHSFCDSLLVAGGPPMEELRRCATIAFTR